MAKTEKRSLGDLGEELASFFLKKRGFVIKDRNYLKSWGEIDIVAERRGQTHFIEVKTKSWNSQVTHETGEDYRPEENVHEAKLKRLGRVIQTYLLENKIESEWQFDVASVYIDIENKKSKVSLLSDLVL